MSASGKQVRIRGEWRTYFAKGEKETLEESCRLVNRLLQSHVGLYREFPCLSNLFSHLFQQDLLVELLTLFRVEIGGEDTSSGVGSVRCPGFRIRDHDESRPHGEGREDLEGFRKRTGFVSTQEFSDPTITQR